MRWNSPRNRLALQALHRAGAPTLACVAALLFAADAFAQLAKGIVRERDVVLAEVAEEVAQTTRLTPYLSVNIEGHTAPVRAIAFAPDGQRLYTAGADKVVQVWELPDAKARAIVRQRASWSRSHAIRWEVARGLRGTINVIAPSPDGSRLAIAGFGARGTLGEVIWTEPEAGDFKESNGQAHSNAVAGMDYSADGRWMATCDVTGRVNLWNMTGREPRPQEIHYDGRQMMTRPVAIGGAYVVMTHYAGDLRARKSDGREVVVPTFDLQYYSINNGRVERTLQPRHVELVSAIAASDDGRYVASSDGQRNLYLHRPAGGGEAVKLFSGRSGHMVNSLDFSADGRWLAVGTQGEPGLSVPQVQLWDVAQRRMLFARQTTRPVTAIAISPDSRYLAHNGSESHHVYLWRLGNDGQPQAAQGGGAPLPTILYGGSRITGAAAVNQAGEFLTSITASGGKEMQFDPAAVGRQPLLGAGVRAATVSATSFAGEWSVSVSADHTRLQLRRNGAAAGTITLDPNWHGPMTDDNTYCFVPDENGAPFAVAVGTALQNGVFVFELARQGECPLLRYLRGHADQVTALSVTADKRYLISGAADGMLCYWKVGGLTGKTTPRRWGAEFRAGKDGGIEALNVVDSGPLYRKGLRDGDLVTKIMWTKPGRDGRPEVYSSTDAQAMYDQLQSLDWHAQVSFFTSRKGKEIPVFNAVAGWSPLLSVYVKGDDWIAWHDSGYYACSPGGERLIGWQVNNQQGEAPSIYPAVRFNKVLYQPAAVARLLAKGGIEAGDAQAGLIERPPALPLVEIIDPDVHNLTLNKNVVTIRARAKSRGDDPISSMHVRVNGVEASSLTKDIVRERVTPDAAGWVTQSWTIPIVSGRHRIEVRADAGDLYDVSQPLLVDYQAEKARRTLHLLAIGVNDYKSNDISDLQYAVSDTKRVEKIFTSRAKGLYDDVRPRMLHDAAADRAGVLAAMNDVVEDAGMGDLVVLFYSGHGTRQRDARGDERYYFVTHDVELNTIAEKGISDIDLKQFCKQVGSKHAQTLLLIDACHSGAMNLDDLTLELQREDYNVAMMASSRGSQVSWEHAKFGGGAFTRALEQAMIDGEAENPMANDGVIDSKNLGDYVEQVIDLKLLPQINLESEFPSARFPEY
ncbi:MAG: caspase family protein, partial [Planctomycetales bacterium]|nr:caspase family protein [Planctomycetales bacterium]